MTEKKYTPSVGMFLELLEQASECVEFSQEPCERILMFMEAVSFAEALSVEIKGDVAELKAKSMNARSYLAGQEMAGTA